MKFEGYDSENGKIKSLIANSADPSIGIQLAIFKLPKEAWEYLSRLYMQPNSAKWYQLEFETKNAEWGNGNIHDFYIQIIELWVQLALMDPQFICTVDTTPSLCTDKKPYFLCSLWLLDLCLGTLGGCYFIDHHCPPRILFSKNSSPKNQPKVHYWKRNY